VSPCPSAWHYLWKASAELSRKEGESGETGRSSCGK